MYTIVIWIAFITGIVLLLSGIAERMIVGAAVVGVCVGFEFGRASR